MGWEVRERKINVREGTKVPEVKEEGQHAVIDTSFQTGRKFLGRRRGLTLVSHNAVGSKEFE